VSDWKRQRVYSHPLGSLSGYWPQAATRHHRKKGKKREQKSKRAKAKVTEPKLAGKITLENSKSYRAKASQCKRALGLNKSHELITLLEPKDSTIFKKLTSIGLFFRFCLLIELTHKAVNTSILQLIDGKRRSRTSTEPQRADSHESATNSDASSIRTSLGRGERLTDLTKLRSSVLAQS